MRARTIVIMLLGVLLGALVWASPVSADDEDEPAAPTTTVPPGAVSIGDGFAFTGAVITSPGEATTRTFDAYQSAVFVQSWLAQSIFGEPNLQAPPPELPVHRLDITGTWGFTPGTLTVYFATDDTTAWVALPGDQSASVITETPPEPSGWFVAEPAERLIGAFNGTEELLDTAGVRVATSTTTVPGSEGEEAAGSSDSDAGTPWIWIVAAVAIVALVGGGLGLRRRRPQPEDAPPG